MLLEVQRCQNSNRVLLKQGFHIIVCSTDNNPTSPAHIFEISRKNTIPSDKKRTTSILLFFHLICLWEIFFYCIPHTHHLFCKPYLRTPCVCVFVTIVIVLILMHFFFNPLDSRVLGSFGFSIPRYLTLVASPYIKRNARRWKKWLKIRTLQERTILNFESSNGLIVYLIFEDNWIKKIS